MKKIKVTDNFIKYSKELAEDILGMNYCFNGDKDVRKKLKYHINKCESLLKKGE